MARRLARSYVRDLVLGANDGIITTFAVVAGVAGAHLPLVVVLLLGFANLVADGFSMGASNYLGARSQEAVDRHDRGLHAEHPPLGHGVATFLAFGAAGVIPLAAYLMPLPPARAFQTSLLLTSFSLFAVGALRSLIIPLRWWKAGIEMLSIGMVAAAGAYFVGYGLSLVVGTVANG